MEKISAGFPMRRERRVSNKRAFTLTELAIVLGVIGLVLGGIWIAASTVQISQKSTQATEEILTIVGNVRGAWANGHFDSGAQGFTDLPVTNGLFPMTGRCTAQMQWPTMGSTASPSMCGVTPWGVEIVMGTQTTWGNTPPQTNAFELLFGSLTVQQCASFLPQFIEAARNNGLTYVYADSIGVVQIAPTTPITTFERCAGNVVLQFTL